MKYKQVLWIDTAVRDYQVFVDSVNEDTLAILYPSELRFDVERIGFVFELNGPMAQYLLDHAELLIESGVKHMDFLACNTLPIWQPFYDRLTGITVGASNNETGNLRYGGDWLMESTCDDVEAIYFTRSIEYYRYLLYEAKFCILKVGNHLWGIGQNTNKQLGISDIGPITRFVNITTRQNELFKSKTILDYHYNDNRIIVIMNDGTVWLTGLSNELYTQKMNGEFSQITLTGVRGTPFIGRIGSNNDIWLMSTINDGTYIYTNIYAYVYTTEPTIYLGGSGWPNNVWKMTPGASFISITSNIRSPGNTDPLIQDNTPNFYGVNRVNDLFIDYNNQNKVFVCPDKVYISTYHSSLIDRTHPTTVENLTNGYTYRLTSITSIQKVKSYNTNKVCFLQNGYLYITSGQGYYKICKSNGVDISGVTHVETNRSFTTIVTNNVSIWTYNAPFNTTVNQEFTPYPYDFGTITDIGIYTTGSLDSLIIRSNNIIYNASTREIITILDDPYVSLLEKTTAIINTSVNIYGYNLSTSNISYLHLDNTSIPFVLLSDSIAQFKVPNLPMTNVSVTMYSNIGPLVVPTPFTILPLFTITQFNPSNVVPLRPLQLIGTNFSDISYVLFGTQAVRPFSVSSTRINVSVPTGLPDQVPVTVFDLYNNNASLTDLNILNLSIGDLFPLPAGRNTSISIRGANLENASFVVFGNVSTRVSFKSSNLVNVSVPIVIPAISSITLYDIYGNNTSCGFSLNTVFPLNSFNPSKVSPGAPFQINGSNFYNISYVKFHTTNVRPFSVTSTQINVSVPRILPNNISVTVVDIYNASSTFDLVTILNMSITSFPRKVATGTPVRILGSNLANVSYVQFGSQKPRPFFVSDTEVNVSIPSGIGNVSVGVYDLYGNNVSSNSIQEFNISYAIQVLDSVTLIGYGLKDLDFGLPSTFTSSTAPMYRGVVTSPIYGSSFTIYPVTITQTNLRVDNTEVVTVRGMPNVESITKRIPSESKINNNALPRWPVTPTHPDIKAWATPSLGENNILKFEIERANTAIKVSYYRAILFNAGGGFVRLGTKSMSPTVISGSLPGKQPDIVYPVDYNVVTGGAQDGDPWNNAEGKHIAIGNRWYTVQVDLTQRPNTTNLESKNVSYVRMEKQLDKAYMPERTNLAIFFGYFKATVTTGHTFRLFPNEVANLRIGTSIEDLRNNKPPLLEVTTILRGKTSASMNMIQGVYYPIAITYLSQYSIGSAINADVRFNNTNFHIIDFCTTDKKTPGLYSYQVGSSKFTDTMKGLVTPTGTFTTYESAMEPYSAGLSRINASTWAYGTLDEQTYWTNSSQIYFFEGPMPITRINISNVQVNSNQMTIEGIGLHANCSVYVDGVVRTSTFNGKLNVTGSDYNVIYVRDGLAYSNYFSGVGINYIDKTTAVRNSSVNIYGFNFSTATISSITLGSLTPTYVILSNTSIQLKVPASTQINIPMYLNNVNLSLVIEPNFTILPPFTITRYNPSVVLTNAPLQIYGTDFMDTSYVTFGPNTNIQVTSLNASTLFLKAPPTAGNVSVTAYDPYGNKGSMTPNLSVVRMSLLSVPSVVPGAPVQITGQNLYNLSYVNFGGSISYFNQNPNMSHTTNIVYLTVPNIRGNVSVGVYDSYGNNASVSFVTATLFSISRYNPSSVIPNTSLQIIGANFLNLSYVLLGTTKIFTTGINTSFQVRVPTGLPDNVSVTVVDIYNNASSIAPLLNVLNLSVSSIVPSQAGPMESVMVYGNNLANTSMVVVNNVSIPYSERSNNSVRFVLPVIPASTPSSAFRLYDLYGNLISAAFTYTPMKITNINVSAIQRSSLMLTGYNLVNLSSVYFGTISALFQYVSTNLSVLVPDQSINCSLVVTDNYGNNASIPFTYNKTTLTQLVPSSGPAKRTVRLSGDYLFDLAYVMFGNSSQSILSVGNGSFNVSVPEGTGTQTLTLYDRYQNTTTFTGYTYENMSVTRINPSKGPTRVVNLEGVFLQNLSYVQFGTKQSILSSGNGSLNVSAPGGTGIQPVTIYDIYGNTTSITYEYQNPQLYALASAPQNASIELPGIYLSNTSYVLFGSEKRFPSFVNGSWFVRVPEGSNTATVTMTDVFGNNTSQLFTYRNPVITGINPSAATRNWVLTVQGQYLENTSYVWFAGQPVSFVPSTSAVTFVLPPGEGNASIRMMDVYGNPTQNDTFVYHNPVITGLNLSSGRTNQKMRILGQHLNRTDYVLIGGTKHVGLLETNASGIAVFLPEKYGNVSVIAVDICGNETPFGGNLLCTGGNVSIRNVFPQYGPNNTMITIAGTNLSFTSDVLLGDKNASILSTTSIRVTARVKNSDPDASGVNITVLDVYSVGEIWMGTYQFRNPKLISGDTAVGTRGTSIRITGNYLANTKNVQFGQANASFSTVGGLHLIAPALPDGPVTVSVTDDLDNTVYYPFTYQNPRLDLQTLAGPQRSPLQITGDYLHNTSTVWFNVSSVNFQRSTQILDLTVPDGSGNASVVVEDIYGNKLYTRFEYRNPNASLLIPDYGPKNMPLVLSGIYLQNTSYVLFGASTLYPTPSLTSLEMTVPDSTGDEVVVVDRYTNVTLIGFRYENPFLLAILDNDYLDDYGTANKPIRVYGTYLSNTSKVFFDQVPAEFSYEGDHVRVIVPRSEGVVSVRVIDRYENEVSVPFTYQNTSVRSFTFPTGTVGWPLTLYGDYLLKCHVLFNHQEWPIYSVDDTAYQVTVPVGTGNVSFQITDIYGNWIPFDGIFEYRNPQLTRMSASTGRAGRTLTLTGEHLNHTSRLEIGSTVYPISALETEVTLLVPDYHGRVSVIAYDTYDASCEIGPFYAMGQEATLVSVNPSRGPNHSPLTIYGTNLSYTTRVELGIHDLSFRKNTSTLFINASTGTDTVTLTVYDEANEMLTLPFTYINPLLEEVIPSEGPSQSPVILRGQYLNRTTTVYVQNTSVAFVPGDDVRITMPILNVSQVSIELVDDLGNRTEGTFVYKNPLIYDPPGEPQRKTIRLYGQNLSNTSTVTFSGSSVAFEATSDYITVKIPDGNVSTTIVVTDRLNNPVTTTLSYQNPSAETLVPAEGTYNQPTLLTGKYLNNTSSVRFGNVNASFKRVNGDLEILIPDSSGNASVVITDIYTNETYHPFVYKNPVLYEPPGEPQRKTIRLYGQNLSNTSTVTFSNLPVSFIAQSDYVEVTVPDGNGSTPIVVIDRWANPVYTYLSYHNPSLQTILPAEGTYNQSTVLTGQYLNNTSLVRFGDVDASFTLVNGDLLITIPNSSGNPTIFVTDRYTNVTEISFVYKNPLFRYVYPSSGPQRRYVDLVGENLTSTSTVLFGAYDVSFEYIEGGLRVKVPDQEGDVEVQIEDRYRNKVFSTFLYRNPRLTNIHPSAGRTNRYTKLYGENLSESTTVVFGDRDGILETATITNASLNVVIPEYYGNVSLYVKDPYGNLTYWDRSFLCLGGDPKVYGIQPTEGTTRTLIRLSGENLSATDKVTVGANASFRILSSVAIDARAPPGTGPAHVIVTDILGEDVVYMGTFQYQNPKITSITPSTGTTNTLVNISGEYLHNTSYLLFGGLHLDREGLSFRVPIGSDTASVELVDYLDNKVRLDGVFTYHNPSVSFLEPAEGPQRSSLRIHGKYLWNTSDVGFGLANASANALTNASANALANASILAFDDEWIDVIIPDGESRVAVHVRDKLNNVVSLDGFTYRNPYFSSIYPVEGPLNKSVQLYGLYLSNISQVLFGGIDISYTLHSDVHIQVRAPNTSGSAVIELVDRYTNRVRYESYLYRNPSITSISPEAGPQRSKVYMVGLNLSNTSYVKFGENNASFEKTNDGLLLTVPDASNDLVDLSVVDTVGNVVSIPYKYLNPLFESINLSRAPQRTLVTLYGQNLSNTSMVLFDQVNASFTHFLDETLEGLYVSVPDADAREVTLQILDPWTNLLEIPFTYLNPRVYALEPPYGPHYARVGVSGENLETCVAYVDESKEPIDFLDGILTLPSGTGTITVVFEDPLFNQTRIPFTYRNASITSMTPSKGPTNIPVTIRGEWLQNTSFVYVNEESVEFDLVESGILNTEIQFNMPSGSELVYVALVDSFQNLTTTTFLYENPELFAFSPDRGIQNSSTRILGKYLSNTSFVDIKRSFLFDLNRVPFFLDGDEIEIRVPTGEGSFSVTVEDRYQNRVDLGTYVYQNPNVYSIEPLAGAKNSSFRAIGDYLAGIVEVKVGGVDLSFAYVETVLDEVEIEVKLPELEGDQVIEMTDRFGNQMRPFLFTYENPLLLTDFVMAPQQSLLTLTGFFLARTTEIRFDGIQVSFEYNGNLNLSVPLGEGNVSVDVLDPYGNRQSMNFFYQNPRFFSFEPEAGPKRTIRLNGEYLDLVQVWVDNVSINFSQLDLESAELYLPEYPDGNVSIHIDDRYGNRISGNYLYQNPDITYITPWHGTSRQSLDIVGKNLSNTVQVVFGNASIDFQAIGTRVQVIVPVGEGEADIVLTDAFGNVTVFDGTFLYENPSIQEPSPAPRNAPIRIQGQFLSNTSTVFFGSEPAEFVAYPDYLDVRVPDSTGPIYVTDIYGNVITTPFSYENPYLQSVFPYAAPKRATIYAYGSYLARTSRIQFGEADASYTIVSAELLEIVVPDASGNIRISDPYDNVLNYTFQYENPVLDQVSYVAPSNASVWVQGRFLGDTVEVWFDNLSAVFVATEDQIEVCVPLIPNASHTVILTAYDSLRNDASTSFTYQNPGITRQSIYSGPKNSRLTLYGYNLPTTVYFGETLATVINESRSEVTVKVPDLYGESVVSVADPYDNRAYTTFIHEIPFLNLLDPQSGPIGKPLNLYGDYLNNTSAIRFGGLNASFEPVSAQWIIPKVPAGTGQVTVEWWDLFDNLLTYPNLFTYENPEVTSLSANQGPQRMLITLYGYFLFETVRIQFGEADADILLIESATSIRIRVPDQVGDPIVPVILTDRYGNTSRYEFFTYLNPLITSITPETGPSRTLVTIEGSNLFQTDTLTVDQIPATLLEKTQDRLQFQVPDGHPGPYFAVAEVTDLYTNVQRILFYYTNPQILSLVPDHGPKNCSIRVEGLYLSNTSSVFLGTIPATFDNTSGLEVKLPPSEGNVSLYVDDVLGNRVEALFRYENPRLALLDPSFGPQKSEVHVFGDYLHNTSSVFLGTVPADFQIDGSMVRVTLPDGTNTVPLTVVDRYGNAVELPFEYTNPSITSIHPLYGRTGRYLTLYGEYLQNTSFVYVGEILVERTNQNTSLVRVVIPEAYGNVSVTVVDRYGNRVYENFEALGGSKYTADPLYGTTSTPIQIQGDLSGFDTYRVNEISYPLSKFVIPPGTGTVPLELYDSAHDDLLFLGMFEYRNPKITSMSPVRGTTHTPVDFSGVHLQDASFVYFGDLPAHFKIQSESIRSFVPAQEGNVSVFVLDNLGNRMDAGSFKYENPDIQAISPHEGPPRTSLRIQGKYLNNTSSAFMNGPCEIESISDDVYVKVPPGTGSVSIELLDKLGNTVTFDVENDGGFTYLNPSAYRLVPSEGPRNIPIVMEGEHLGRTERLFAGTNASFSKTNTQVSFRAPLLEGTVDVFAEDDLGNVTTNLSFTYLNPSIRDYEPSEGPPNIPVILDGYHLANTSSIRFGSVPASFEYRDGWLYTHSTENTGNVSIYVTDRYENTVEVPFRYNTPTITKVEIQGRIMKIQGEYLYNTSKVILDDQDVAFQLSPTGLIADLLNASGSIAIEAIDRYGNHTLYGGEFYYDIPSITSIYPHSGLAGSVLTVHGINFSNTTYVTMDGKNASIQSFTATQIRVQVPEGSGHVQIEVFEQNLNSTRYSGRFTYETITIYKVEPLEAYANQTVFIEGSDLSTIQSVEFGEYIVTDIKYLSKTLISVKVPPIQEPSIVTVKSYAQNKGSYLVPFRRKIPTVDTLSDSRRAGDLLFFTGNHLDQVQVFLGTASATIQSASMTHLVCTIPYGIGTVPITFKDRYQNTYVV